MARKAIAPGLSSRFTVTRVGPPTIGEPPNMRRNVANSTKRAEDASLNVAVEWAAVARAIGRQFSRPIAGIPQLTMIRFCLGEENSNDKHPAWASRLSSIGGAHPGSTTTTAPPPPHPRKPAKDPLAK